MSLFSDPRASAVHCGQRFLRCGTVILALCWGLSGCSQFEKRVSDDVGYNQQRTVQAQNKLRTPSPLPLVVIDKTPRFASQTIAVQEDQVLPSSIGTVTLRYPGRHSLLQAADLITRTVKIPVVMTPDALFEAVRFSPLTTTTANTTVRASQDEKSPSALRQKQNDANEDFVARQGGGRQGLRDDEYQTTVELNYSGNLELLDQIAAKTGLFWRFAGGAITFSRIDTQTFMIKAHPGGTKFAGDVTGTNTENSGGSMTVSAGSETDFWGGLNESIKNLISRSGRYVLDAKNGTVTVIDSVVNVRAVGRLIERYNELSLRQIVLNVEVLQIQLDESKQMGIDWATVSKQLQSMSGAKLTLTGPPALSNATTGSLGLTLSGGTGQLDSGRLLINALETFGKVSTAYSVSVSTTNRQPVPVGALNNLSYVKQTSAALTSATSGLTSAGSLVPGVVQTGFAMTLIPTILDSNRIMLQTSMTISTLKSLKTFTSGGSSVQTPEVDSFNTMQRMSAATGDTIILMGYEREGGSWATNDLVQGSPVPGFRSGNRSKVSTVVLVTPLLQDF